MMLKTRLTLQAFTLLALGLSQSANAAVGLDRTRVIFDGGKEATSVNITNNNTQLPYLAQGWIEDEEGKKITSPLIVLPPVQRLEPGKQSQVKVQALPAAKSLPQDRETVYYFNLREIPPRSDKANTLQIALQTRIKLFYRPQAIAPSQQDLSNPWQEKLTLTREGERYQVNNPTPYYVTLVDARSTKDGKTVPGFEPLMVPPKGTLTLGPTATVLGTTPYLAYVNDYGGRPVLAFTCGGNTCKVNSQVSTPNEECLLLENVMKSRNVKVLGGLLLVFAGGAQAEDVEGMNGLLKISGAMHETPCSLEMASLHQTVDLGAVSTSQLQRPGDQAKPVAFQLRFTDCHRTAGSIRSERTGNLTWSAFQPVLSVAFSAPADADDPRLVKVQGVTGMGLQLTDALGRDVQLGARGEPLFLPLGGNVQTWNVQPTRTSAALTSGAFRAVVDFRLNYE